MIFEQINTGGDRNYGYLIGDEASKEAALIDPSYSPEKMVERAEKLGLNIVYIINTHGHYDHINGNETAQRKTGAKIAAYKDAGVGENINLSDGDVLKLGELELKIVHTPGHTADSLCLLAEDKLCTGDTLFVGKVGGTGFGTDAKQEYESLHNKIMTLPDNVQVYPGHNYGTAPSSTIKQERESNPFLLQESFDKFLWLKKNWLQYKIDHGIQ